MGKIRNLSVRKTIILYMAVSLMCSFLLSALIGWIAMKTQEQIWWKYVDEDIYFDMAEGEAIYYMINVPRPESDSMTNTDRMISELCDFIQTYFTLLLSMLGSSVAVILFYRNKLKYPIAELEFASVKISRNDLDFHITYENKDEMGRLCREFERMRQQLAENNQKLWRSLEEEKALRAAITHDLRSPLSVLKGYHEMLMDFLPDGDLDLDKTVEMLSESRKQIQRMDTFVETMRKMSSLEQRQLYPVEITASQLQTDITAEAGILEKEAGRQIRIHVADAKEVFCGDKEVILEVTENLLSNALRYARKEVELGIQVTERELRICVKDDGKGFGESKEMVTRAYYQQNTRDSLKHTGMGMYISRLYCEKHGGKLLLENRRESGACVTAVFCRIA